jgi:DNA-binding winged helix-turn-helix (wHTH) protein/tetratricopeptide (TPR) repeat protein
MDSPAPPPVRIQFGSFELDATVGELREGGQLRGLPAQPLRVLVLLTERAGEIVTRQQIRRCLWGERKYVDADRGINFCINQIRNALRDPAEHSRYIKTLPRRGYSFIAPVKRIEPPSRALPPPAPMPAPRTEEPEPTPPSYPPLTVTPAAPPPARRLLALGLIALLLTALTGYLLEVRPSLRPKPPATLTPTDFIVLADVNNTTGESVFDDSLTHALATELHQSPLLSVLPAPKVRETLKLMGLSDEQRITPAVAREICLRTGSKAVLSGAISHLGAAYLLQLDALGCGGDTLASARAEAGRQEDVLKALGSAATRVRYELGESLPSVQKFEVPAQATTTSLEALKSFTTGLKVLTAQGDAPAVPFFKRALELDPHFAMANAALASRYNNLDQPSLALDYATRAYQLRDTVTEPERLLITARYLRTTGELEKLTQTFEMWKSEYPRDGRPAGGLCVNYMFIGNYSKALAECEESIRLDPGDATARANLISVHMALQRVADAQAAMDAAVARGLDGTALRRVRYALAFLHQDTPGMQLQVDWAIGKPGSEDALLSMQSDTEAYFGRSANARRLVQRAVDSAVRADLREAAALWQITASLWAAEFGERRRALSEVNEALAVAADRNVKVIAALTLARAGDIPHAQALVAELQRDYPDNSVMTEYRLPSIKAAIAIKQGDPRRALDLLEGARPSELGQPTPSGFAPLYPPYLRGEAYLALHNGAAAAIEFQKVIDAPGIALNSPVGVMARLEQARAAALAGDPGRGRSDYQDFISLWASADPDIPVLIAARRELAGLQPQPQSHGGRTAQTRARSHRDASDPAERASKTAPSLASRVVPRSIRSAPGNDNVHW